MRKMSKAAKADAYDALESECSSLRGLAHLMINESDPPMERVCVDRYDERLGVSEQYELRLYGATRADGGTLLTLFHYPGQSITVSSYHFDTWLRNANETLPYGIGLNTEIRIAADKLRQARSKLLDIKYGRNEPACARDMGCLCAGHARGANAALPCDTTE